ncbi:MAG: heavy-metal-associated domain-containing protein [Maribacter sp.]|jgi:copper chaperone CopZ|nr:heavy-metal-associated domain-containing protein [Maribacter sp.]MBT8313388.1 heavy-metal-associated domain-containing protein [Maribacter sp.]
MKATIIVQNLKCGGCARTITNKLTELDNISEVQVFPNTSTVSFAYQNTDDALMVKDKLKDLGYPSIDSKNSIAAKAKSFVSCATGRMTKQ